MSLREQIHDAQVSAMKNRDADTAATLRMLWSAIRNEEIEKHRDLSDDETQAIVARQMKQLADAQKDFVAGARNDLVEKTAQELRVLEKYLPAQLSDEELERLVKNAIAEMGAAAPGDAGKVIGAVMKTAKGKADGNRVRIMVGRMLAGS